MAPPQNIRSIWARPEHGIPPDLSDLLHTRDPQALSDLIAEHYAAETLAHEQEQQATIKELEAMQRDLAAKGVTFDVAGLLRPSLSDRIALFFDDVRDWIEERFSPAPHPDALSSALPPFSVHVARTHPTNQLLFEYEDIYAETDRFQGLLAEQISASRVQPAQKINLPQHALDFVDEDTDWTEAQELLVLATDVTRYFPPKDERPGFGVLARQEDGGMPIEIDLAVFSPEIHAALLTAVQEAGGQIA